MPALQLGLPAMDGQHAEVFGVLREVVDLARRREPPDRIGGALDRLRDLTIAHFRAEEGHMAAVAFPEREGHAAVHRELLQDLARARAEFEDVGRLPQGCLRFLVNWWVAHIEGIDRKYADWARSVGVPESAGRAPGDDPPGAPR